MIRRTVAAIALIHASFALPASAQKLPAFYVFGEDDIEGHRDCSLTHVSATAAVQAAFRYNNAPVASKLGEGIHAYINLTPAKLNTGVCILAWDLEFSEPVQARSFVTAQTHNAKAIYCSQGGLLWGPAVGLQARVNEELRQAVDQCISTFLTTYK
jgi:hypothetical protein